MYEMIYEYISELGTFALYFDHSLFRSERINKMRSISKNGSSPKKESEIARADPPSTNFDPTLLVLLKIFY